MTIYASDFPLQGNLLGHSSGHNNNNQSPNTQPFLTITLHHLTPLHLTTTPRNSLNE